MDCHCSFPDGSCNRNSGWTPWTIFSGARLTGTCSQLGQERIKNKNIALVCLTKQKK